MVSAFGKGDFSFWGFISACVGYMLSGTWQAVRSGRAVTLSYGADLRLLIPPPHPAARIQTSQESSAVTRLSALSLDAALSPAAETLSQTTGLIHRGLLQSTEARRLLRREGALSAFGFLSVYFRNTKKKSISIQGDLCSPTQKSGMLGL